MSMIFRLGASKAIVLYRDAQIAKDIEDGIGGLKAFYLNLVHDLAPGRTERLQQREKLFLFGRFRLPTPDFR